MKTNKYSCEIIVEYKAFSFIEPLELKNGIQKFYKIKVKPISSVNKEFELDVPLNIITKKIIKNRKLKFEIDEITLTKLLSLQNQFNKNYKEVFKLLEETSQIAKEKLNILKSINFEEGI